MQLLGLVEVDGTSDHALCHFTEEWLAQGGRGTCPWKQLVRASSGISTCALVSSVCWKRICLLCLWACVYFSLCSCLKSSEHKGRPELSGWEAHITSIWWGGSLEFTLCFNFGCDENLLHFQPCWTLPCPWSPPRACHGRAEECCVAGPRGWVYCMSAGWGCSNHLHLSSNFDSHASCQRGIAFYFIHYFKKQFIFIFWPCHTACGILVPQLETEARPLAVKAWSPNPWTTREFPGFAF